MRKESASSKGADLDNVYYISAGLKLSRLGLVARKYSRKEIDAHLPDESQLDEFDRNIIAELVSDSSISSKDLVTKFKAPLSTVQRRRKRLEQTVLKKEYSVQPQFMRGRNGLFLISTNGGSAEAVAKRLYEKYPGISKVTIGVGGAIDIVAAIHFEDSEALYGLKQEIERFPKIDKVEFFEIVKVAGQRHAPLKWLK